MIMAVFSGVEVVVTIRLATLHIGRTSRADGDALLFVEYARTTL